MSYSADKKILILGTRIPTPDLDAGSERMISMLFELRKLFSSVTFFPKFPLAWPPYDKPVKAETSRLKQNRISVPSPEEYDSLAAYLENSRNQFDAIVLSDIYLATECLTLVRRTNPQANIIFDTVDLHYLRYYREAKLRHSQTLLKKALQLKKQELNVVNQSDLTLVVTNKEKIILEQECPGRKIAVLSGIYPEQTNSLPFESRQDLLFIGSFDHRPNLDAVEYFINDIFPLVQNKIEHIKFFIIGAAPPEHLKKLDNANIVLTGYVPDLKLYFNQCRLSIAPLRFGAGMKGKILTSMSYGLPTIATSIAAEGLPIKDREHLFIADEIKLFAERLLEVYQDKTIWEKFSSASRDITRRYYSREAFRANLIKIWEMLAD